MNVIYSVLGGALGAAVVTGTVSLIQFFVNRCDKKSGQTDHNVKALRYLMLYIIQERAKQHIKDKQITLEERRSLHHWHDLYHNGLGGNGDADTLMSQVDKLPVDFNN